MDEMKSTYQEICDLLDEGLDRASIAGKLPDLTKSTVDRYYYKWKKERAEKEPAPEPGVPEPVAVEPVTTVGANGIPVGGKLIYNGELFRRVPAPGGRIILQRLVLHQFSNTFIPRGTIQVDPGTQVQPS